MVSYQNLKHTENKLTLWFHQLAAPQALENPYWAQWAKSPLHEHVLTILREFKKHQLHWLTLKEEQHTLSEQIKAIHLSETLSEQDRTRTELQLESQYTALLKTQRNMLKTWLDFLDTQQSLIAEELTKLPGREAKAWTQLIKRHLKILGKEFKTYDLSDAFKPIKQNFS